MDFNGVDWARVAEVAGGAVLAFFAAMGGTRTTFRKRMADLLRPVVSKELGAQIRSTVARELGEGMHALSEEVGATMQNALAVHRQALLEDMCNLLRTEGATRAQVDALRDRLSNLEGSVETLTAIQKPTDS